VRCERTRNWKDELADKIFTNIDPGLGIRIVTYDNWAVFKRIEVDLCGLVQWYSTFFVRVPPDIISLQLCTPKVVGTYCKLYILYNLHLK
jgi:hypothetical protein